MNYLFENDIESNGIPTGRVFFVNGAQGAGKTSLCTALLRLDFKYHSARRLAEACAHYKEKGLNTYTLPCSDALRSHLYYSNVEIALKGRLSDHRTNDQRIKYCTHFITPDSIALPDGQHPSIYFPWGSVIYLQEASDSWHAHDWASLAKDIRPWLKYLRQANLTLIIDTHNDTDIAKQLRELATDELYVEGCYYKAPKWFKRFRKPVNTWYFHHSLPQSLRAAERRMSETKEYSKDQRFHVKDDVRHAYDSFSGELLFLRGVYNYGFTIKTHPPIDYTYAGIENYCNNHPINMGVKSKEEAKNE